MLDLVGRGGLALAVTISPPRRDPLDDACLEDVVARTWCASAPVELGPWLVRVGGGFSAKANAVAVVRAAPVADLPALVGEVEAAYAARRLPARFEITDTGGHEELVGLLAARGYVEVEAEAESTLASPLRSLRSVAPPERDGRVAIADAPSPDWLDLWWSTVEDRDDARRDAAEDLLWDLPGRRAFAAHIVDGQLVATGLAVLGGPWIGMFCLGTRAERRSRGSARRIVGALATWGVANAARRAYVSIPDAASRPRALADGLGFTAVYRSRFLQQPS